MITRYDKVEALIDYWTDAMSLEDLIAYYQEQQQLFLDNQTDAQIDELFKDNITIGED